MNYIVDTQEFLKCAGIKDFAVRMGKKIVDYSPDITGQEEGLKGINRARQIFRGDLAKKYYKQYSNMPAGPEKEKMMRQLVDEDTKSLQGKMLAGAAGVGGLMGTSLGVNYLGGKLTQAGGYLARKGLMKAKDIETKEDEDPIKNFQNQLQGIEQGYGKVPREILERLGDPDYTKKVTLQDIQGPPLLGAMSAATLGLTGKTMAANLLGAQTFYHGTPKENVDSILQNGIDPSYGGREGGGAWKIDQKTQLAKAIESGQITNIDQLKQRANGVLSNIEMDNLLEDTSWARGEQEQLGLMSKRLKAKMKLMGIGKDIPMDTTNFVENARGRSYVAKGLPGRAAATAYGRITDPKAIEDGQRMMQGTMKRIKPLMEGIEKHPILSYPMGFLYGATKAPFDMLSEGKKYYDRFVTPKDTNVVGGVLPQEVFDARFERDPDDVMRMQSGYRTQQKIEPQNLAKNEVSLGQIWKNRTRNYGNYVKNNKGKVLSGLGLLGLNAAMTGSAIHNVGRTVNKIVPDSIKDSISERFNN
jgi:hypothetical protein